MKRTRSGLWIAPNFNFLRLRARERTVTLPNGERAKLTVDDSGTVRHLEHGDQLDALVTPQSIKLALRLESPSLSSSGTARPRTLRTRTVARMRG